MAKKSKHSEKKMPTCHETKQESKQNTQAIAQQKCFTCGKPAKIFLPYGPKHYCAKHFTHQIEKRVCKNIRQYDLINPKEKIVVAVSGGKDSMMTLHVLWKYYHKSNEITALMINEGIQGYREKAIEIARTHCKEKRIPFVIAEYSEEYKHSLDEIGKKIEQKPELGTVCSFCGILRRQILNKNARKLKADKLVTGHNLDDEVQTLLMNLTSNHYNEFMRTGASTGIKRYKDFVPRIKPLYEIPENEIIAYTAFNNIPHYSHECCPYSWQAKRNEYRMWVNEMERKYPGTKFSIIHFFNTVREKLKPIEQKNLQAFELNACTQCGEPSSGKQCSACKKLSNLNSLSNK